MAECKVKGFYSFKDRDTNECYAKLPCVNKPKTNYDRIRNMSIEEMAEFLEQAIASSGENLFECIKCEGYCEVCYLKWLQEESEE